MNTAIQAVFGPAFGPDGPIALRDQGDGNSGGVGQLAVATPVLRGVCCYKTYPRSYRRVGGRYRQPARQNTSVATMITELDLSDKENAKKVATEEVTQRR
jgi:hypothetical protein